MELSDEMGTLLYEGSSFELIAECYKNIRELEPKLGPATKEIFLAHLKASKTGGIVDLSNLNKMIVELYKLIPSATYFSEIGKKIKEKIQLFSFHTTDEKEKVKIKVIIYIVILELVDWFWDKIYAEGTGETEKNYGPKNQNNRDECLVYIKTRETILKDAYIKLEGEDFPPFRAKAKQTSFSDRFKSFLIIEKPSFYGGIPKIVPIKVEDEDLVKKLKKRVLVATIPFFGFDTFRFHDEKNDKEYLDERIHISIETDGSQTLKLKSGQYKNVSFNEIKILYDPLTESIKYEDSHLEPYSPFSLTYEAKTGKIHISDKDDGSKFSVVLKVDNGEIVLVEDENSGSKKITITRANSGKVTIQDKEPNDSIPFSIEYSEDLEKKYELPSKAVGLLKQAIENGANIIIFPEFVMSPGMRKAVEDYLKQTMHKEVVAVFAGTTFERERRDKMNNVMHIYNGRGVEIGKYYKYSFYNETNDREEAECNLLRYKLIEYLTDPGQECTLFSVQNIGLILPSVCRDIIEGVYTDYLAKLFQPDLIVIPAWSKSAESFTVPMRHYADTLHATSVLCNCCNALQYGKINRIGGKKISAACVPKKNKSVMEADFYDDAGDGRTCHAYYCGHKCNNGNGCIVYWKINTTGSVPTLKKGL